MQNTNHDKNNSNDKIYVYNTDKQMVYVSCDIDICKHQHLYKVKYDMR